MADVPSPTVVYLDQLHWVELSKIAHGKAADSAGALELARRAVEQGVAVFPISGGHFFELQRISDVSRREKLGAQMWELSQGRTLIDYGRLIQHEIASALRLFFPDRVPESSIQVLGRGIGHAFNKDATIPIPPKARERYSNGYLSRIQSGLQLEFERSLLTGYSELMKGSVPRVDLSAPAINFRRGLEKLRADLKNTNPDLRRRALEANAILDIYDPLLVQLGKHGITWDEFAALGPDRWHDFLEAQPYRRLDLHLRNHLLTDRNLPIQDTDFNDWAFVGMGALYCDVVATEKQFADILNRRGFEKRAVVYTRLSELAQHLSGMDHPARQRS